MLMSFLKKLKEFYNASPENRIGLRVFLGFVIIPFIGLTLFYIYVYLFWL